ncbi:MAG: alpha-L-fucosidase [Cyclobacteriaceae bacterium]|nr:alpha-L-fucosidase [Cyclobacteriaceae bacterium]
MMIDMLIDRRKFLKSAGLAGIAATSHSLCRANTSLIENSDVLPTPVQQAWMDMKFGMFVHFGINTYYDVEWSDGTLDPVRFNPTKLDTDQWCRTAVEAGMKYIVFITKHHDGFCLWPSKYTDYSVKSTPFKKDVLAEVVNSANKYGLKVGMYYSLWDRREKSHDEDEYAYVDFMKKQLEELLTNYGPVVEMWFDGFWKKQQHGWAKKLSDEMGENVSGTSRLRDEDFVKAWRMEGAYRWQMDHLYQFIKELQSDCLVMNNATTAYPGVPLHPVDIRSGEKYTTVKEDRKIWNWLGKDMYLPLQIETTMSVKGDKKFPSGNWFWHDWDDSVASLETLRGYLSVADKMGANLLLNVGPDDKGQLRKVDEKTLKELRAR